MIGLESPETVRKVQREAFIALEKALQPRKRSRMTWHIAQLRWMPHRSDHSVMGHGRPVEGLANNPGDTHTTNMFQWWSRGLFTRRAAVHEGNTLPV